jgi:hypothetical protein
MDGIVGTMGHSCTGPFSLCVRHLRFPDGCNNCVYSGQQAARGLICSFRQSKSSISRLPSSLTDLNKCNETPSRNPSNPVQEEDSDAGDDDSVIETTAPATRPTRQRQPPARRGSQRMEGVIIDPQRVVELR